MWQSHPDFRTHVEEWWRINVEGATMFRPSAKLDNVRSVRPWHKRYFGNIFKTKKEV